jgi:hypothetical protein
VSSRAILKPPSTSSLAALNATHDFLDICVPVANDPLANRISAHDLTRLPSALIQYLLEVKEGSELMRDIAGFSYQHPLGYSKIVLWEGESGQRIRLHSWKNLQRPIRDLDVHDHYWDFRSIILSGEVVFSEFDVVAKGDEYTKYSMIPVGNGAYDIEARGRSYLTICGDSSVVAKSQYAISSSVLHSTSAKSAITLVFQGSRRQDTNVIYRPAGCGPVEANGEPRYLKDREILGSLSDIRAVFR